MTSQVNACLFPSHVLSRVLLDPFIKVLLFLIVELVCKENRQAVTNEKEMRTNHEASFPAQKKRTKTASRMSLDTAPATDWWWPATQDPPAPMSYAPVMRRLRLLSAAQPGAGNGRASGKGACNKGPATQAGETSGLNRYPCIIGWFSA